MKRIDFKAIFGVSFSKNMDIFALSKMLQVAIPYVEKISPDLFKFLNTVLKTVDHLMVVNEILQSTTEKVQKLEKEVLEKEEQLKKATNTLVQANQDTINTIGASPSIPPFVGSSVILTPLSQSLIIAEQALERVKEQLKTQRKKMLDLSQEYKDGLNNLTSSIEEKVKSSDLVEKIDTDSLTHIYR